MTDTAAADAPPLTAKLKLLFGVGAMGEAVYLGLFNAFITIYYNQAIGLSNTLIGAAIMLAMLGDAVTDPVVGVVSDRWKSAYGRRHPFLFAAPLPLAIALFCIFNPPQLLTHGPGEVSQWGLFAWLAAWTILSRAFLTLYSVPHLALGGELSKDQHERSQLFSANTVVAYVSGASFAFVAWSFFFAGERVRESDGALVPAHLAAEAYGPLVLTAGALILISIWLCAAGTYSRVRFLSIPEVSQERLSILMMIASVLRTLKNRNYMLIMLGYFFFMIASGIFDTLNVFMSTYYWELPTDKIRWLGLIAAPGAMCGALSAPRLMHRFDRKPVMIAAVVGVVVFTQLMVDLRLLDMLPNNGDPRVFYALLANAVGFTFSLGVATVAVMSMLGDIIDENELTTGKREEGLFYSARALFAKASYSFGHFFAGIMLDLFVRLPFNAVPGELGADVLTRMGLTAGPIMGVAGFFALLLYSRYDLNKKRHAEIRRQVEERRVVESAA